MANDEQQKEQQNTTDKVKTASEIDHEAGNMNNGTIGGSMGEMDSSSDNQNLKDKENTKQENKS